MRSNEGSIRRQNDPELIWTVGQNDEVMTEPEWKAEYRRQLETAGEAQVRAELRTLLTGEEGRRLFVVRWLRDKEEARKQREDWFYWGSLAVAGLALAATAAGVVTTIFVH
jgi:hypothetical protein